MDCFEDQKFGHKIKWSKTSVKLDTFSTKKEVFGLIGGFQESLCRNSGEYTLQMPRILFLLSNSLCVFCILLQYRNCFFNF